MVGRNNHFNLDNLKITNQIAVKHALWDARAKWRDIGSCISIDEGTLDTIIGGRELEWYIESLVERSV